MSRRLRSQKEEGNGVEQVLDRMVKGMRNEMNTVIWKIERSRDVSPEALKYMVKNGLDAMVGAVEKAMYGVSDGLAKERKEREQKEEDKKWRMARDSEKEEEKRRREEERVRKLEEKLERVVRENEERWKERDERMRVLEERKEKEEAEETGEIRRSKEVTRNMEDGMWESEITITKERMAALEERLKEGGVSLETKDREAHARIDEIEKDLAMERKERKEFECDIEDEKGIQDAKESERDMERILEGAMEQVKILNLDFGKECVDRTMMVKEAVSLLRKKVTDGDKEELGKILKGARIDILGKRTSTKEVGKGRIHTVPVLITCGCRNAKGRLEAIVRKAGLVASFQWPKECMEFVNKVRDKVETMGFGKEEFYTRVRPAVAHGRVLLRVDTKKKEGGKFKGLAYWRAPPKDKEHWKRIIGMVEPEWMIK
jgi:hypothetical protein